MITRTTSTNATTYTQVWNADNKLSEVKNGSTTLAQFFYDADGARVKKVEGNTTTIYVGEHYEKNISTGAITKYYDPSLRSGQALVASESRCESARR
jgi:hypothetical protein